MSGEYTRVSISTAFCPGEQLLKIACSNNNIFAVDLNAVRQTVHEEIFTIRQAIERMDHIGSLDSEIKVALKLCLGRIASGECPNYPPLEGN
jgi:hypothetical protein